MYLMLTFCVYLDIIQGIMFRQDIVHHLTPVQSGQGTSNDHGNIIITGKDNLVSYNVIHISLLQLTSTFNSIRYYIDIYVGKIFVTKIRFSSQHLLK